MRVLFVCMGNICRSPSAEGVFRQLLRREKLEERVEIGSAGTHDYHVGSPPDERSLAAAAARGLDISALRARQVSRDDFQRFDWIVAMDRENLNRLRAIAPNGGERKLHLFLDFAPDVDARDVPDPYYGGAQGFEQVLDLLEAGAVGLLDAIRRGN